MRLQERPLPPEEIVPAESAAVLKKKLIRVTARVARDWENEAWFASVSWTFDVAKRQAFITVFHHEGKSNHGVLPQIVGGIPVLHDVARQTILRGGTKVVFAL